MPTEPAIEVDRISHSFGENVALDETSFTVHEGELFGIIGPDGAGKTTLLRALAGVLDLQSGNVSVLGQNPLEKDSPVRELVGYMPQRYSLYGDLSVIENLRFFSNLFCLSRSVFRERVQRLLTITRLEPFQDRRAEALSGGMYKKLALACALLHEPRVLLLDEPTNGVDPVSRIELWELLNEFIGSGMTIVVSTSYMDEAVRCGRVALIHKGRTLALGTPEDLVAQSSGAGVCPAPRFEDVFLELIR